MVEGTTIAPLEFRTVNHVWDGGAGAGLVYGLVTTLIVVVATLGADPPRDVVRDTVLVPVLLHDTYAVEDVRLAAVAPGPKSQRYVSG